MPGHTLATLARGADAGAIAAVLDLVERAARASGLAPRTVDRVVLVAGEALSNAVEHGDGEVTVEWVPAGSGGRLRVAQGSGGPGAGSISAARLPDEATATRGRGLYLIQQLADRVEAAPDALTIWFEGREGE